MDYKYLVRQVKIMYKCIENYEDGIMSIDKLYNNLDFLYNNLISEYPSIKDDYIIDSINQLEIINACIIENIITEEYATTSANKIVNSLKKYMSDLMINYSKNLD